jgi:hypothetical protein
MSDKAEPEEDDRAKLAKFAAERSHKDAETANRAAESAGRALLLINGGAATAIIAFLARDSVAASFTYMLGLLAYSMGVVLGAYMLYGAFCMSDWDSLHWRLIFEESRITPDAEPATGIAPTLKVMDKTGIAPRDRQLRHAIRKWLLSHQVQNTTPKVALENSLCWFYGLRYVFGLSALMFLVGSVFVALAILASKASGLSHLLPH